MHGVITPLPHMPIWISEANSTFTVCCTGKKVKVFRYKPEVAVGVPGG
jgi:hypothetical protein